MGCSNVITAFMARGVKLLGLAIPLTTLALIMIMTVQAYSDMMVQANNTAQAYNGMANLDFAGHIEVVSSVAGETASFPQTSLRGR